MSQRYYTKVTFLDGLTGGVDLTLCVLANTHGDPQLIQLTCISNRIFRELNRLINNFLPQQHRDTLSIVDIKATKSSESEYNRNSFSLSLDGYRDGKVLKPDWQFLLDSTDPYRELNKEQELLLRRLLKGY